MQENNNIHTLSAAGALLETLSAQIKTADNVELPPPCNDGSCRSMRRTRGGMRTNGGCRCSPIVLALEHAHAIVRLTSAPSWERAMHEAKREEERK